MAVLALAAPVTNIGSASGATPGPLIATGLILPAAETALGANTGCTFPNNGAVIFRAVIGGAGAGNITFVLNRTVEGQVPAAFVVAVANSTSYLFGPFSPADFNDANGNVDANFSVQTGNSVGVYILPNNVFGK
jgi:hypothetical protein